MNKNEEGTPIKCSHCDYKWLTKSEKIWVVCPNCLNKTKNPGAEKHER
jgi:Zn finger protein HypA/HybF involved in hydrogenase expression